MSETERKLNGRPAIIERLKPLATSIATGKFSETPTEAEQAEIAEMITQGMTLFPKLTSDEQRGLRHVNKPAATHLATFLYKHSTWPMSPYAASLAAQRYLFPSTRNRSNKRYKAPWTNGWTAD